MEAKSDGTFEEFSGSPSYYNLREVKAFTSHPLEDETALNFIAFDGNRVISAEYFISGRRINECGY